MISWRNAHGCDRPPWCFECHHNLPCWLKFSLKKNLPKYFNLCSFILSSKCQIGIVPLSPYSVSPKLFPLSIDSFLGKLSRFLSKFQWCELFPCLLVYGLQNLELKQLISVLPWDILCTAAMTKTFSPNEELPSP